jgi:peptidoglycan/xylan/chitin deacetylase (PgdA/CDA1 family)
MTHPDFTDLTAAQIRTELSNAEAAIRRATGHSSRPLFRFPYGERDARTIRTVNELGYVAVRWTVDTLGWKGTSGGQSTTTVRTRTLDALRPGEIVLMHVGANPTDHSTLDADALPGIIDAIRGRGYQFVTLDALLTAHAS